ncbi:Fatty acyl-CoA reductase [Psidium guajava]|nr:Fatty acyl-CoA reductase [Psidium guajava]
MYLTFRCFNEFYVISYLVLVPRHFMKSRQGQTGHSTMVIVGMKFL